MTSSFRNHSKASADTEESEQILVEDAVPSPAPSRSRGWMPWAIAGAVAVSVSGAGVAVAMPQIASLFGPSSGMAEYVTPPLATRHVDVDDARGELQLLPVVPEASDARFSKEQWEDRTVSVIEGCMNSASWILIDKASKAPSQDSGGYCEFTDGEWIDPYSGQVIRGRDHAVIDLTVPAIEVWRSGGHRWEYTQHSKYINDLAESRISQVVSAETHEARQTAPLTTHVETGSAAACALASDWIAVKRRWDLSVDADEVRVLQAMLDGCDGTGR